MQIIVFTLNDNNYAITTDMVEEISRDIPSTIVPNAPNWVEGLINLRGNVVTLLNLSKLLQQEDSVCYNNIIIINNNDEKVGIMVQEVVQVIDIKDDDIQCLNSDASDGILGIVQLDDLIINILDIDTLLSKNEGFI
jgi:purine-binding chemotaxis protein CheW